MYLFRMWYTVLLVTILAGSTVFAQTYQLSGTVSDPYGPLIGATVQLQGTKKQATTGSDGTFSFDLKSGTYYLKISAANFTNTTLYIPLENDTSIIFKFIPPNATKENKAEPLDIITSEDLMRSPHTLLSEALQYLVPAFHSVSNTQTGLADHISSISMRGLSSDYIKVLINGIPMHQSPLLDIYDHQGRGNVLTNLNVIPITAVDHIEIIRDAMSVNYGSGVIGGVINIVLKSQTDESLSTMQAGITTEGDGIQGFGSANYGFDLKEGGFANITGSYSNNGAIDRSGTYSGAIYGDIRDENPIEFFEQAGLDNGQVQEVGRASTQDVNFWLNSRINISSTSHLYARGGVNHRAAVSQGNYLFPKDSLQIVESIFPYGFAPNIHSNQSDFTGTFGFKGLKNGWLVDANYTLSHSHLDASISNSNNASMGVFSPESVFAGRHTYTQNLSHFKLYRGFNLVPGLDTCSISFGGNLNYEQYKSTTGELASWQMGADTIFNGLHREGGIQGLAAISPLNARTATRTTASAFMAMESEFFQKILMNMYMRYDAFSDIKDQMSSRMVARFHDKWFTIRGSFGMHFRAPSLQQIHQSEITQTFAGDGSNNMGLYHHNHPLLRALGISELGAERAQSINVGVVFEPFTTKPLSISIDAYQVGIKNRIVLSQILMSRDISGIPTPFTNVLEPLNIQKAQFFLNALETQTQGMNMNISYDKIPVGRNKLSLEVGGHFHATKILSQGNISNQIGIENISALNRNQSAIITSTIPSSKIIIRAFYEWNRVSLGIQATQFGKVTYQHIDESRDQVFPSRWVLDMNASVLHYLSGKNPLTIFIGINNLMNTYPESLQNAANSADGRYVYSPFAQQFGVGGMNAYLRMILEL